MEYIISGIIGLLTGAIGSLVAPWINWKIEQKKELLKSKIELISNLRLQMQTHDPKEDSFLNSVDYIRIRPYLSFEFVKELEDSKSVIVYSSNRSYYKSKFLEELENIESSWDLLLNKKGISKKSYHMQNGRIIKVTTGNAE